MKICQRKVNNFWNEKFFAKLMVYQNYLGVCDNTNFDNEKIYLMSRMIINTTL